MLHFHLAGAQTAPEGKYLLLNGIDQYFQVPNQSAFNIAPGESYTICCRINPDNFNAPYKILSKGNTLLPEGRYDLSTYKAETGPNIALNVVNSSYTNLGSPYFARVEPGIWVHVAWVYNAGDKSSRVYVNGVLANTVYSQYIGKNRLENSYDLTVGCGWTDAEEPELFEFWPGRIDELRIWKRALSPDEVSADRTATKAVTTGLTAAYDFEHLNGSSVPDVSGKGHNGQLFGYGIRVVKTWLPVGAGSTDERLTAIRVIADDASETISSLMVDLSGTDNRSDILALKAYHCGQQERFNPRTARLLGSVVPTATKTSIPVNLKMPIGTNYFWITADVSPTAQEGNHLCATVLSYTSGSLGPVVVPDLKGFRKILLTSTLLFSGGDGGSSNYRIPALATAMDGSLIAATDKRWESESDLPAHIDVVIRRSTDLGRTWSPAVTIAGNDTQTGFGDPALVVNRKNGEIICLLASNRGFYNSTSADPIRIYLSKSTDHGVTWSIPRDITPQLYGVESQNPITRSWQGAFVTSGSAIQLHSGRLMAAMPVRETTGRSVSTFVIYSDDNGTTWKVSPARSTSMGSEAKLVELYTGQVLMSIRNQGYRIFALSKDPLQSWGNPYVQKDITDPACNGDMIRYTSVIDGFNKNRLLHSIPYSGTRKNVSVLLSYDEGITWPVRKTIYLGASAYSAMAILPDGTIGIYYEVGEYETYQMYFARFSLNWLTDGADTWSDKWKPIISSADGIAETAPACTVYPNPASGSVYVSGIFDAHATIELYDPRGVKVSGMQVENPLETVQISLAGLSPGIYFLKVGQTVEKIIVQ
jgi:hypothetical protein